MLFSDGIERPQNDRTATDVILRQTEINLINIAEISLGLINRLP